MSRKNSLKPLKDRINDYQMARRQVRMQGRATVAAQLVGANNQLAQFFAQFYGMPLWKRVLWFLFGYKFINWKGALMLAGLIAALVGLHILVFVK